MDEDTESEPIEFEGKYFRDQLQLKNNLKVLGEFEDTEEPAVVENKYGKGTAILSAVPLGASYYNNPNNSVNRLIINFTEDAGVIPDAKFISKANSFLNIKVHISNNYLIVYIINSDTISKKGLMEINSGILRIRNLKNILTEKIIPFEQKGKKLSIPVEIKGQQVMVLYAES
jgi:hypothetical protein